MGNWSALKETASRQKINEFQNCSSPLLYTTMSENFSPWRPWQQNEQQLQEMMPSSVKGANQTWFWCQELLLFLKPLHSACVWPLVLWCLLKISIRGHLRWCHRMVSFPLSSVTLPLADAVQNMLIFDGRSKPFVGEWLWKHLAQSSTFQFAPAQPQLKPLTRTCVHLLHSPSSHTASLIKGWIHLITAPWLKQPIFISPGSQNSSFHSQWQNHCSWLSFTAKLLTMASENWKNLPDHFILYGHILGISALTVTLFFNPQSSTIHGQKTLPINYIMLLLKKR